MACRDDPYDSREDIEDEFDWFGHVADSINFQCHDADRVGHDKTDQDDHADEFTNTDAHIVRSFPMVSIYLQTRMIMIRRSALVHMLLLFFTMLDGFYSCW